MDYKSTLNLPQTQFPMRAEAAKREPAIQAFWQEEQIYQRLSENNPGDPFVLHDGPPYANGDIHMGTTLNKILKDIVNKYHILQGRKVRYVPGWDCHGLPIELKVLQSLSPQERQSLTPLQLRQKAREYALHYVNVQRASFQRLGVWGDWDRPYLTLSPEYEAAQIEVFGQMALKGYIYRGLKPVHWSPSSQTALAEAELEYPDNHISPSIYVAFPLQSLSPAAQPILEPFLPGLRAAIWTTTPWTIPANLALCFNPKLTYAVVESPRFGLLLIAADLRQRLEKVLETPLEVKATLPGSALEYCQGRHPLFDRSSLCVLGDYVTTESGTGIVHTAPGHGEEDFKTGQKYGLPILSPVDEQGRFTAEAGSQFVGLDVLSKEPETSGNLAVIKALRAVGALLKEEPYNHKYPYDWRTKEPTIFRATEQWFASVAGFRELALQAIKTVKWIPPEGENRITAMVKERSDWCISRQRAWGVPIPSFTTRRPARCCSQPKLSTTSRPSSPKRDPTPGGSARWRSCCRRSTATMAAPTAKGWTPWTCGLTPALPGRQWPRRRGWATRWICIWKAPTNTEAGSNPVCLPPWPSTAMPPTRRCSPMGLCWTRKARK